MRINQNIEALNAWRNLSTTNTAMGKSLEKLSSGFRINRAADDASGLVISQGLRAQVSGLRQATRNAQDGISVVQTAEGALNEVHSMLNRMRDLAVQASNTGTNDTNARTAANAEVTQLSAEIDRIAGSTKFGAQALLDGTFGVTAATKSGFNATGTYTVPATSNFTINVNGGGAKTVNLVAGTYTGAQLAAHVQNAIRTAMTSGGTYTQAQANAVTVDSTTIGAGFSLSIKAAIGNTQTFALVDGTGTPVAALFGGAGTSSAAAGTGGTFQVGSNAGDTISVALASVTTAGLGVSGLDLINNASAAITALDSAITSVSTTRGNLGAVQNRFESTINNLQVTTENLASSESRIRDTDMALEMTEFTRHQVLLQAGTAMLGQANQLPQSVLRLLQ
jgi:flagellin